jgi:hypothetical protein
MGGFTDGDLPICSANLEAVALVLSFLCGLLLLVLDHPVWPVHPGFKDIYRHFLVNSNGNFSDRVQEVLSALTIVIG